MSKYSPEEIQKIKYELWSESFDIELESVAPEKRLVAEGDSWFDYPPGLDILDYLKKKYKYKIHKVAEHGDTLENMVYGTEIRKNFTRRQPPIFETLNAIRKHSPKVVLISGGGNDIAGNEIGSFLNHKDSGLPLLREDYTRYVIFSVFKKAYEHFMTEVWKIDDDMKIISHGYGHAIPDGRAVINLFDLRFIGPWLRPTLAGKNIINKDEAEGVIRKLIDLFNDMLAQLDNENQNFHYLDLRPIITELDWINELHLYNDAYEKVADVFHAKIQELI